MSREQEIAKARQALAKKYGKEVFSATTTPTPIEVIPTGAFLLDCATGVGGFPRGRLVELFGLESSGKSTISLSTAKNCQRLTGLPVLYLDYEHAFDISYAEKIGVDTSESMFILSQPESLEQGMSVAEYFIEQELVGLTIVDSLAAMVSEKELTTEIGHNSVALQARAMASLLKRLTHKIHKSNSCVLFINQLREGIATMPGRPARRTTPGGRALKFYASMRIELAAVESVKGKVTDVLTGKTIDGPAGVKINAKVVKNKLARPFQDGTFYLGGDSGICPELSTLELGVARNVIKRNGSRYILPFRAPSGKAVNLAGQRAVLSFLQENPAKHDLLFDRIKELMTNGVIPEFPDAPDSVDVDDSDDELEEDTSMISGPKEISFDSVV